jgi:threonyl-tRNA synthetase
MILQLPDGRRLKVQKPGISLGEALKELEPKLDKKLIGARRGEEYVDLYFRIPKDEGELELLTLDSEGAKWIYRHSMAHIMAQAVKRLFPEAKLAIGPSIEDGFYYDFDVPEPFKPEDLEKITKEMEKIIEEDHPFERIEVSIEEARRMLEGMDEPYKLELLDELEEGETISFYKDGEFIDLCRGPHIPSTGMVKHFKLLEAAGAYWRGDESRKMLQRIYGTAFLSKEDLEAFLRRREEAARRDHRVLGRELDLFSIHHEIGGGLVHWHPKGALIRYTIEKLWYEWHLEHGYQPVYTPHIASEEIYKISGHLENYAELMYAPMQIEGRPYRIKPMNCPGHIMIYKTRTRSYRELPIRYCELGTVYRFERSGVLHGLLRVRGFTIDDAHIFCRPDQVEAEILEVFSSAMDFLRLFGFEEFEIFLATRPEQCVGAEEDWERATEALKQALDKTGLPYEIDEGGGAFYGPKIDVKVKDALGRSWQCSTIQFDFNLPERFDLTFAAEDGREHRPYMVHRALLGSLERFFGALIEHYAGAFPVWLAPVQAVVLPIADRHLEYAEQVLQKLKEAGIRAEISYSKHKTLSYRVRDAQLQKIPYMLVVGDKEEGSGTVALRLRTEEDLGPKKLEEFITFVQEKIARREAL